MTQRNCPNCAAPYDIELNKCPYCGTSYYDLSALDLTAQEPFYLKIKVDINGSTYYITQLVRPRIDVSIEFNSNDICCHSGAGNRLVTFTEERYFITNLSFKTIVTDTHKNLCTIEVE